MQACEAKPGDPLLCSCRPAAPAGHWRLILEKGCRSLKPAQHQHTRRPRTRKVYRCPSTCNLPPTSYYLPATCLRSTCPPWVPQRQDKTRQDKTRPDQTRQDRISHAEPLRAVGNPHLFNSFSLSFPSFAIVHAATSPASFASHYSCTQVSVCLCTLSHCSIRIHRRPSSLLHGSQVASSGISPEIGLHSGQHQRHASPDSTPARHRKKVLALPAPAPAPAFSLLGPLA